MVSITKQELEAAEGLQLSTKAEPVANKWDKSDVFSENMVLLDDTLRAILGIETWTLR